MPAAASIRIDQPANPTTPVGQPGRARDDLILGQPVSLRNSDDTDVLRWVWRLVDIPIGSTAVLSGTTAPQVTFTPDVVGSYLIELAVNDGIVGQIDLKVAAVRNPDGYRFPATGETAESVNWPGNDEKGWGKDAEELLRDAAGANTLAGVLAMSNATGGNNIEITDGDSIVGQGGGSISFTPAGDIVLEPVAKIVAPDGSASAGSALDFQAGAGDGAAQPGGNVSLVGGPGDDAAGAGGGALFSGGPGGATSGPGGAATVQGGDAAGGNSDGGPLMLMGGQASGSGTPGELVMTAASAVSGNVAGAAISGAAGDGSGSGAGGDFTCSAGDGGATGAGGPATISAGAGGATSGAGGVASLIGGPASGGNSIGGDAIVEAGPGSGNQPGGQGTLRGGDGGTTGDGGPALVQAGDGGATSGTGGPVQVFAGHGSAANSNGGSLEAMAGNAGAGVGTGGSMYFTSGDGGGASGNSGNIVIATGGVTSGTQGTITLNASDVIIANHSYHSVRGSTQRGSAATRIYRWTDVVDNVGTDIVYTDSATDGGYWTIQRDGIYAVSFSLDVGHNGFVAIKKAAAISNTFDETAILVAREAVAATTVGAAWTGFAAANQIIWIATSATTDPTGAPANNARCSVTRVR